MCEPVTMALASMGAGLTGATVGVAGTAAAASQAALAIKGITGAASAVSALGQASAQNAAAAQNAQSAKDAYFIKTRQSNLRVLQEQNQASMQKRDADLKALKAQSTAISAAAGSGVQGVDIDRLMNDFERSQGILSDRIDQRLEGIQAQNNVQNLAFQSEATNRINSMQPANFAETLFNVVKPAAGFGLDYMASEVRLASETGATNLGENDNG